MKTAINKPVPPIGGYYGGKAKIREQLADMLPTDASILVSPFAGFASVEMASPMRLILNDKNVATASALYAIKTHPEGLINALKNPELWTESRFLGIKQTLKDLDRFDPICLGLGIAAIAYSAMAHHRGGSVSGFSSQQAARAAKRDWSYLYEIPERLKYARITSRDFRVALDSVPPNAAIYLDPPYLSGGEHYQVTMTEEDHRDMLTWAISTPNPIMISGYDSALYRLYLGNWRRDEIQAKNNLRNDRIEVIWRNY